MKTSFKWLLTHCLVAGLGIAYVWAFSPSEDAIPFIGGAFAMSGSVAAFWPLIKRYYC